MSTVANDSPVSPVLLPARGSGIQRPDVWLITAAVICNVLWRLVRYGLNFPVWGDEAMLAVNICDRDWMGVTRTLDYNQTAPIGFLWAEQWLAALLGQSLYALRLLPLISGICSTLLFVRLAVTWLPRRSAMLAIAVFCASYYPVRHSTEIKPYASDLFLCLCLTILGLALHRNMDRMRCWLAFALLSSISIWCSYPAVFVAGGILLSLLPNTVTHRSMRRMVAWSLAVSLLCISFVAMSRIVLAAQSHHIDALVSSEMWRVAFPPLDRPWEIPLWFLRIHAGRMMAYPVGGDDWASLFTLVLVVIGIVSAVRSRSSQGLSLLLAPAAVALVAACVHKYPYGGSARTSLYLAPTICLLAGSGCYSLCRLNRGGPAVRKRLRTVCVLLILLTCGGVLRDVVRPYKTKSDEQLRTAFTELMRRSRPNEPWVIVNQLANHERNQTVMPGGLTVPNFDFYTRTLARARLRPQQHLDELASRQPAIWLIRHFSTRHPIEPSHQADAFSRLTDAYVRAEQVTWHVDRFESLQAWRFSHPRTGRRANHSTHRMADSHSRDAAKIPLGN